LDNGLDLSPQKYRGDKSNTHIIIVELIIMLYHTITKANVYANCNQHT